MKLMSYPKAALVLTCIAAIATAAFAFRGGRTMNESACRLISTAGLPDDVHESSGLARGTDRPGLFWTHNDSGDEPVLYAVSADGALVERVRLRGARSTDWEDIEAAPCAAGSCLYVADTGDNDAERRSVTIYELVEPPEGATEAPVTGFHGRYPDGARDAEALFAHGGELYVVTKGRHGPIDVFRFPRQSGGVATLRHVARIGGQPEHERARVTAATTSPGGGVVVLRTHEELRFHRAAALLAGDASSVQRASLGRLGAEQGEAVAIDDAGGVWLSSEGEDGASGRLHRLSCSLEGGPS